MSTMVGYGVYVDGIDAAVKRPCRAITHGYRESSPVVVRRVEDTDLATLLERFDVSPMGVVGRDGERLKSRPVSTAPKYAARQMFEVLWRLISNQRAGFSDAVTLTLRERSNRNGGDMLVAVVRGGDIVVRAYGRTLTMTSEDGREATASCVSKLGLPRKVA